MWPSTILPRLRSTSHLTTCYFPSPHAAESRWGVAGARRGFEWRFRLHQCGLSPCGWWGGGIENVIYVWVLRVRTDCRYLRLLICQFYDFSYGDLLRTAHTRRPRYVPFRCPCRSPEKLCGGGGIMRVPLQSDEILKSYYTALEYRHNLYFLFKSLRSWVI